MKLFKIRVKYTSGIINGLVLLNSIHKNNAGACSLTRLLSSKKCIKGKFLKTAYSFGTFIDNGDKQLQVTLT